MMEKGTAALVFVVDDEPTIAQTAALILCGDGFDARAFTDPIVALKAAQTDPPSLLLTDVIMPNLNGFELSTGIVEDCPQCKVISFSGNPGVREYLATTPTEKNLDLLVKPIQPVDLLNAIRSKLKVTSSIPSD